jgi:hypothetical protein
MSKKLRGFALISSLVLLASALVISGCSDNSPLQPNLPQTDSMNRLIMSGMSGDSSEPETVSDSELIEKDVGGTIEIERESYLHLFTVPEGALDSDTEITVESWQEKISGKEMIVFDFGPDGLVFKIPAKLDFDMAELNSKAKWGKLYYFDPVKSKWEFQGSSSVVDGIASFDIDHFSKYAIGD